jgi:hypothetical protein
MADGAPISGHQNTSSESHVTRYWRDKATRGGLLVSGFIAMVGFLSLWLRLPPWISFAVIIGADIYIISLLIIVGLHADRRASLRESLPYRFPAFVIGAFLFIGLLHAFGNLYLHSEVQCPANANCSMDKIRPHIENPGDALYFSIVTMSTLGYGDFYPGGPEARHIVIWQLANSVLLIVLLLPLVVSRFATF